MYHQCPICHGPVPPGDLLASDTDWTPHRLESGAPEAVRSHAVFCERCDESVLVTVTRDDRGRERVSAVESLAHGRAA